MSSDEPLFNPDTRTCPICGRDMQADGTGCVCDEPLLRRSSFISGAAAVTCPLGEPRKERPVMYAWCSECHHVRKSNKDCPMIGAESG